MPVRHPPGLDDFFGDLRVHVRGGGRGALPAGPAHQQAEPRQDANRCGMPTTPEEACPPGTHSEHFRPGRVVVRFNRPHPSAKEQEQMKRMLGIIFFAGLAAVVGCGGGASDQNTEVAMEPAPLIDRELFFGDPEISGAQLSPDGKWMSFLKPYEGARNIWVKTADEPFEAAKPVTADERPVPGYFWSRDSRHLMYVQDKGGNENFPDLGGGSGRSAGREERAAGAGPDARRRRAGPDLLGAQGHAGPDHRRAERPGSQLPRHLQGQHHHRRAHAPAREHRQRGLLDLRQRGRAAPGLPLPARRRRRAVEGHHAGLRPAADHHLRGGHVAGRLPPGPPPRLRRHQQGRA